jgi:hypothetical protein
MVEFMVITTSVVNALTPLLLKALEKGAEKVTENAADTLFSSLKKRLSQPRATEALDELARNPSDPDNQAAVRAQLLNALQDDPDFAVYLRQWIASAAGGAARVQTGTASNGSTVTQIQGSNNTVR